MITKRVVHKRLLHMTMEGPTFDRKLLPFLNTVIKLKDGVVRVELCGPQLEKGGPVYGQILTTPVCYNEASNNVKHTLVTKTVGGIAQR